MEPDYQNNYQDELHLDDEVYEIKSDRINPEYLNNPPRRKRKKFRQKRKRAELFF